MVILLIYVVVWLIIVRLVFFVCVYSFCMINCDNEMLYFLIFE